MSTEFFNDQWRIPSNENQNKVSNYSMDFDGTSDIVNTTLTPPTGANDRTISVWFKTGVNTTDNICGYGTFATKQAFDIMVQANSRKVGVHGVSTSVEAFGVFNFNEWNHYVATYDGTILRGYLNGQPVNTSTIALNTGTSVDFTIGSGVYTPYNDFSGSIDQVSIFDYVLSASQVSTLYGGGTAITNPLSLSPKPISYYQLGDQSVDNGANYLVPNNSLSDYVFNFDGVNDYLDTNSTFNTLTSFTVSAWFKADDTAGTVRSIVSTRINGITTAKGFDIYISANVLTARVYDNGATEVVQSFTDTTLWHNVVMTYNGTTLELFLDNSSIGTATGNYDNSGGRNLTFGKWGPVEGGNYYFDGLISNVAIFNTALTDSQVETIYNNGAPNDISSLNPVGWYKLNAADTFDGTDWTINDYGSGGNDGTSSGMDSSNLVVSDLQQTSGYSPYALGFDGINDYLDLGTSLSLANEYTISSWININNTTAGAKVIVYKGSNSSYEFALEVNRTSGKLSTLGTSAGPVFTSNTTLAAGVWYHAALTKAVVGGTKTYTFFLNGQPDGTGTTTLAPNYTSGITAIGRFGSSSVGYFNGEISNLALWNSVLTSTQITEIYNQGVPSNLNTFSGTAPIAWWQLGSNSSFNTQWTCLDEIGTNNGVSVNMANDDITNGVGYSANGLGTSSIDIVGDAPYSTANGLSENMDVLDRTTDVPS